MTIDDPKKTYDCEPTLTDTGVIEFCNKGFLMLEGVVPDEINRRTFDLLDAHPHIEPTEILEEDWFIEGVNFLGSIRVFQRRNVSTEST